MRDAIRGVIAEVTGCRTVPRSGGASGPPPPGVSCPERLLPPPGGDVRADRFSQLQAELLRLGRSRSKTGCKAIFYRFRYILFWSIQALYLP